MDQRRNEDRKDWHMQSIEKWLTTIEDQGSITSSGGNWFLPLSGHVLQYLNAGARQTGVAPMAARAIAFISPRS